MIFSLLKRLAWTFKSTRFKRKKYWMMRKTAGLDTGMRQELLFLSKRNIPVALKPWLGSARGQYQSWTDGSHEVQVDPTESLQEMAITLVHEARHARQQETTQVEYLGSLSHPRMTFLFNRMMEADAFAHEVLFQHRLSKIGSAALAAAKESGKKILPRRQRLELLARINADRRNDVRILRVAFFRTLQADWFTKAYDRKKARYLTQDFARRRPVRLLREGFNNLRRVVPYLDHMKNADLHRALLRDADRAAYADVNRVEKLAANRPRTDLGK